MRIGLNYLYKHSFELKLQMQQMQEFHNIF